MTDLPTTLPRFSTTPYSHLLPSLDRHGITVADLISLDELEIARRAIVPIPDVRRLARHVVEALQADVGLGRDGRRGLLRRRDTVSLLDDRLDRAVGGGIPTGYVTEITGESAAGKTQLLLTLLLSAQLPPPLGLSKTSVYISTESALSTSRLSQLLARHPRLSCLPPDAPSRPSLSRVLAIPVQDLESQDHILTFQLPQAIRRHDVGLVVIDSVAANYRAEHGQPSGGSGAKNLADRAVQLARLGRLLRDTAKREDVAVVVANQVSDRFEEAERAGMGRKAWTGQDHLHASPFSSSPTITTSSSPAPASSPALPAAQPPAANSDILTLNFQQRFFTGWGDRQTTYYNYHGPEALPPSHLHPQPSGPLERLKTPALGLTWTNQIACRIVLKLDDGDIDEDDADDRGRLPEWDGDKKPTTLPSSSPPPIASMNRDGINNGGNAAADDDDDSGASAIATVKRSQASQEEQQKTQTTSRTTTTDTDTDTTKRRRIRRRRGRRRTLGLVFAPWTDGGRASYQDEDEDRHEDEDQATVEFEIRGDGVFAVL